MSDSAANRQESPVKCRRYKHGGARFYTVDTKGVERLLADTYNAKSTERVAKALGAEVEDAMTYRCAQCGGAVTVPHAAAWPSQCPHCKTAPPTLIVKVGGATVAAGRTEP